MKQYKLVKKITKYLILLITIRTSLGNDFSISEFVRKFYYVPTWEIASKGNIFKKGMSGKTMSWTKMFKRSSIEHKSAIFF